MIFPILMGVGYMAVEYLTFNLATANARHLLQTTLPELTNHR